MFDPGVAIGLELIALAVGALVIIACHNSREDSRINVFPKFVGYFTVIIAFIALLGSVIACFNYWMDAGGTVRGINSHMPTLSPPPAPPMPGASTSPTPPEPPMPPTPPTPSDNRHPDNLDDPRDPAHVN